MKFTHTKSVLWTSAGVVGVLFAVTVVGVLGIFALELIGRFLGLPSWTTGFLPLGALLGGLFVYEMVAALRKDLWVRRTP